MKVRYFTLIILLLTGIIEKNFAFNNTPKDSLIAKNKNSNFANTYKTENTYFKYFLNKGFLISKIEGNVVEEEQNFLLSINDQSNRLNIFFDKNNYLIKGWETIDLYGNKVRTNIVVKNINQELSGSIFNLNLYN